MISIIIPHHNEDKVMIRPLMSSINSQIGIDFNQIEILLCSDIDNSPLDDFDFNEYENIFSRIRKIKSPYKNNPGLSRQSGIDEAVGEYVIFCDADDALYHLGALRELMENIENTHADIYRFTFMEEIGSEFTNKKEYRIKRFNWTWVFAKAYKTEFLRRNNIRFSKELLYHEDSYFNYIARALTSNYIDIDPAIPFYLWKYSNTSITRKNQHEYSFLSWGEYIKALSLAINKSAIEYNKNCSNDIINLAVQSYITLMNPNYCAKFKGEEYNKIEKSYYDFLTHFFNLAFEDNISEIEKIVIQSFYNNKPDFIPEISWRKHVQILREKYK